MYCADALVDAFPDAKLIQIIRDGRDVVAAMLGDPQAMSWFRPGLANVESEFPNPFYGVESEQDKAALAEPDRGREGRAPLARLGAPDGAAAGEHVRGSADDGAVRGHAQAPGADRGRDR